MPRRNWMKTYPTGDNLMIKHFILHESGAMVVQADVTAKIIGEKDWSVWFRHFVNANNMVYGKDFFLDFINTEKSGSRKKELMAFVNPYSMMMVADGKLRDALLELTALRDSTMNTYEISRELDRNFTYLNRRRYEMGLETKTMTMKRVGAWVERTINTFTPDEMEVLFSSSKAAKTDDFIGMKRKCNNLARGFWNPKASSDNTQKSAYILAQFKKLFNEMGFDMDTGNRAFIECIGEVLPGNMPWQSAERNIGEMKRAVTGRKTPVIKYKPMRPIAKKRPQKDKVFHFGTPDGVIRQKADTETVANFGRHGV